MSYRKIVYLSFAFCILFLAGHAQMPSCSAASRFFSKDSINVTTFGASTVAGVKGLSFQEIGRAHV